MPSTPRVVASEQAEYQQLDQRELAFIDLVNPRLARFKYGFRLALLIAFFNLTGIAAMTLVYRLFSVMTTDGLRDVSQNFTITDNNKLCATTIDYIGLEAAFQKKWLKYVELGYLSDLKEDEETIKFLQKNLIKQGAETSNFGFCKSQSSRTLKFSHDSIMSDAHCCGSEWAEITDGKDGSESDCVRCDSEDYLKPEDYMSSFWAPLRLKAKAKHELESSLLAYCTTHVKHAKEYQAAVKEIASYTANFYGWEIHIDDLLGDAVFYSTPYNYCNQSNPHVHFICNHKSTYETNESSQKEACKETCFGEAPMLFGPAPIDASDTKKYREQLKHDKTAIKTREACCCDPDGECDKSDAWCGTDDFVELNAINDDLSKYEERGKKRQLNIIYWRKHGLEWLSQFWQATTDPETKGRAWPCQFPDIPCEAYDCLAKADPLCANVPCEVASIIAVTTATVDSWYICFFNAVALVGSVEVVATAIVLGLFFAATKGVCWCRDTNKIKEVIVIASEASTKAETEELHRDRT